jgi:DNA-binding transcriptional ArsR family regulator
MNKTFYTQFVPIDFKLLDNKKFMDFIGTSAFKTYIVLRRNVWRSTEEHYMGLHKYYDKRLLTCSLEREKISEITGIAANNISHHLTDLEKTGIIQRIRTGKQNIYVLGEWIDVLGSDYREVEWFFMEGVFGISKADLMVSVRSHVTKALGETYSSALDNNNKDNKEENTVNGVVKGGEKSVLQQLPDVGDPPDKTAYIAKHVILQALGDEKSSRFYELVAAKIPEQVIREVLSEVKVDGARNPAKLFTYKIKRYALEQRKRGVVKGMGGKVPQS